MSSTLAFHGDTELQDAILAQVDAHTEADAFIRGEYYRQNGQGLDGFRGCFIGCAVHSYELANGASVDRRYSSVEDVEAAFNFDPRLTKICEQVFEGCGEECAQTFLKRVSDAAAKGADRGVNVRLAHWVFLHRMVRQVLADYGTPEVRKGCSKSVAVLRDLAKGVNVTRDRAASAAYAARSARAAYAARSARAAYASRAARAADAAARAADAAADAADAAYAAYAAARAARAAFEKYGDWIIEILAGEAA